MEDRKPGVYLCKGCGIGEAVSVDELEAVAGEMKAPLCRQHDSLCAEDGVAMIKKDLAEGTVNQVVIAACSSRVMTDRFDFDGAQVIRANLREQVVWTHPAGDEDTQMMAADNLRMAIAQAGKTAPPEPWSEGEFSQRILVVGGGVSGLSAAREAAAAGHEVLLVERADTLGGWARKWAKRMPHRPPYRDPQENDIDALIARVEGDNAIIVKTDTLMNGRTSESRVIRSRLFQLRRVSSEAVDITAARAVARISFTLLDIALGPYFDEN